MRNSADGEEYARYQLIPHSVELPDNIEPDQVIRIPVRSIVCASTTHASYFSALGQVEVLSGLAYAENAKDSTVVHAIESGAIKDVTGSNDLDLEQLIALGPDLVILYPSMAGSMDKIREAGIQVLLFAEHTEPHPLGRSEWLKVAGALLNENHAAEEEFLSIEKRYKKAKTLAVTHGPKVFFGSAWKAVWHAPGGQSVSAQLLKDAGAKYIFADDNGIGNIQMDLEVLLESGEEADWWGMVLAGDPTAFIDDMEHNDPRMMLLKPVKEKQVFYCNSKEADYFGRAVLEPDVQLLDLIHIFAPEKLPEHMPVYFKRL